MKIPEDGFDLSAARRRFSMEFPSTTPSPFSFSLDKGDWNPPQVESVESINLFMVRVKADEDEPNTYFRFPSGEWMAQIFDSLETEHDSDWLEAIYQTASADAAHN